MPDATVLRVVREIRRRTVTTRPALREVTRLSETQLRSALSPLIDHHVVARTGPKIDGSEPLYLAPDIGGVVAVDLTLDTMTIAVTEADYTLQNNPGTSQRPITMSDYEETLDAIADGLVDEVTKVSFRADDVIGIGLSIPGAVRRHDGVPDTRFILPAWDKKHAILDLSKRLAQRGWPGAKVVVGNDASLGALGAYTRLVVADPVGASRDLIYMRITHGVGAGIVMKGHLVNGGSGYAGEVGHMQLVGHDALCPRCGGRGCLETVASEDAVLRRVRKALRAAPEGGHRDTYERQPLTELLHDSHPAVARAVWDAGWYAGMALGQMCTLLNPTLLVLGGALGESSSFYGAAFHALSRNTMAQIWQETGLTTWNKLLDDVKAADTCRKDLVTRGMTAELLGGLAFVVDELGDDYLTGILEKRKIVGRAD